MVNIIGYTTINKLYGEILSDKDIALRDLLNHFYTQKGERINNPEFGSIIPLLLWEQNIDDNISEIEDDVRRIINNDSRWNFINNIIDISENTITINIDLEYKIDSTSSQLLLEYNSENIN